MGLRIASNLVASDYEAHYVEVSESGIERLRRMGLSVQSAEDAVPAADAVVMAVPDTRMGEIAAGIVPSMKRGAMLVMLDPAAWRAGHVAFREEIAYFVTHPCHPSLFNDDATPEARGDHFGGVASAQHIVCALPHGAEQRYDDGVRLANTLWAPVKRAHRLTVEQMAILEPTVVEVVLGSCTVMLKEAVDEAVRLGVPAEAAREFMLGHLRAMLAITFGEVQTTFSDAAWAAIRWGSPRLFQRDWKSVFRPEQVEACIGVMLAEGPENKE